MALKVAVIGGGASGLAAASQASSGGAQVVVLESSDRVGRTILATGNGRCNFSNASVDAALYHNADYVEGALAAFEGAFDRGSHPNGVVAFFHRHGMLYREEGEGRLYPFANKSSVVLDVLRASCASTGVEERICTRVAKVEPPRESGRPFTLRMADGAFERADRVVVACGGKIPREMLGFDVPFSEQRPVLCSIATETTAVRELDNIRAKATLWLLRDGDVVACEHGEAMFRKHGVSGICAFNLSRLALPGDVLSIDLLPMVDGGEVEAFAADRLRMLREAYPGALSCEAFLRGLVLPRVADVVLKHAGIDGCARCDDASARLAIQALKAFDLRVSGPGDIEHAQVARGGFDPYAFDSATMESLAVPGLHVTGEALDVDGPCGGYNLHWAFATGLLAGRSAALGA